LRIDFYSETVFLFYFEVGARRHSARNLFSKTKGLDRCIVEREWRHLVIFLNRLFVGVILSEPRASVNASRLRYGSTGLGAQVARDHIFIS
jgi:hypothetical protein